MQYVNLTAEQKRLLSLYDSLANRIGSFEFDFRTIRSRTGFPASLILKANRSFRETGLLQFVENRPGVLKLDLKRVRQLGIEPLAVRRAA